MMINKWLIDKHDNKTDEMVGNMLASQHQSFHAIPNSLDTIHVKQKEGIFYYF